MLRLSSIPIFGDMDPLLKQHLDLSLLKRHLVLDWDWLHLKVDWLHLKVKPLLISFTKQKVLVEYNPDPLPLDTHPVSFENGSSDDPSAVYMQKQRILKKKGLLKEELDWPAISLIAGSLHEDGYITHIKLNQIMDKSQHQRKAVDMLLKVVMENLSTVSAFMRILNSESDLSYVARRINNTRLSSKQMNRKGRQYYDPSAAYIQKQRILKKKGLLKEELDWPGIRLIAGNLQKDGYITHTELNQIMDKSQPRRKAVNMLLKVVMGNLSTVSAFMRILNSESDLSYVARRINRTQLSAKQMNRKGRQYYDPSAAYMQKQRILKNNGLLKEELDWPAISLIAGYLQKGGYITYDELDQIMDKSQPRRKAVDMLLKVVMGNLSTVSAFMRILNSESDLSYVAVIINRTRLTAKEMNDEICSQRSKRGMPVCQEDEICSQRSKRGMPVCQEDEICSQRSKRGMPVCQEVGGTKKCKRLNRNQKGSASDAVKKILSSLRTATVKQKLRHASKHLNLELKEAFMESFGIMFTFKVEEQSQKLKDPFPAGSESFADTPIE